MSPTKNLRARPQTLRIFSKFASRVAFKVLSIAAAGVVLGLLPGSDLTWSSFRGGSAIAAPEAEAQNFGQRVIQGKVFDNTEQAVAGATVFLENLKNRDVKSFTTPQSGGFRFAQVGMIDDYQVWAEKGRKKSSVKTISSFDSRKEVDFDLHLK